MNLKLTYLYRDAGNYKYWNAVVFRNRFGLLPEEARECVLRHLLSDGLFVADQVRLEELFPYTDVPTEDDHCLHEFHSVEETEDPPADGECRDFLDFIKEVKLANERGWRGFVVAPRVVLTFIFDRTL